MGDYLTKGTTYVDGGVVNASNLNAHVDDSVFKPTAITNRTDAGVPGGAAEFLIADAGSLKKCNVTNLATAVGGGSSLIHGKTAITALTSLDELLVWEDGVAADRKITVADIASQLIPSGGVLKTEANFYTANTSITAAIPIDDTVPTSSEGTQILTQAITPVSSSSEVLVRFTGNAAVSSTGETAVVAMFRGTTCIGAQSVQASNGVPATIVFAMEVLDTPATGSAITYTVRAGVSAGSLRFNGYTSGRIFGGAAKTTLIVQEIKG